jgi:hypothetical protein
MSGQPWGRSREGNANVSLWVERSFGARVSSCELERQRRAEPAAAHREDLEGARRALAKLDQQQARLVRRFGESGDSDFPWELVEREVARLEREKKHIGASISNVERPAHPGTASHGNYSISIIAHPSRHTKKGPAAVLQAPSLSR